LLALFGKKQTITCPKLVFKRAKRMGTKKYYIFVIFDLLIIEFMRRL